jgi:clan AA aspartic protease (TIGR02281 family)
MAYADTLYLKNGRSIEGVINREEADSVELDVGFGTVSFRKNAIERISRSTPAETAQMRLQWKEKIEKEKAEREARIKAEIEAKERAPRNVQLDQQGGHIAVDTFINGQVHANLILDTGASLVVISQKVAAAAGIDVAAVKESIELQVADGRKVSAKLTSLKSVSVEGTEAVNVAAAVMPEGAAMFGSGDGLLGMSFLKLFNFKVDQKANKLVLEKL